MNGSYVEVEIASDAATVEMLVGLLSEVGVEGFWEEGGLLRCYVRSERWRPEMEMEIARMVKLAVPSSRSASPRIEVRTIAGRNWNEEWERTIKPIRVTDRIVIAPSWETYDPSPGEILIRVDPKMSFGTGYHESTRLALRLLQRHVRNRPSVLDIGTGTGVLVIAALLLGARSALGLDNDQWAYENAQENLRLNNVQERGRIVLGDVSAVPLEEFNVVVCNIHRTAVEQMLSDLIRHVAHNGVLILSGLLSADREPIMASLRARGLRMVEEVVENEWIGMTAAR